MSDDWKAKYRAQEARVVERLKEMSVLWSAVFVPQSVSRNANEKTPSLNWRFSFRRDGKALATDYMQGIGHVPGYRHRMGGETIHQQDLRVQMERAAETGKAPTDKAPNFPVPVGKPHPADVLQSLLSDASGASQSFDDWCGEYGYDADSRKAEQTYFACVRTARDLASLFTSAELAELRTILEDR